MAQTKSSSILPIEVVPFIKTFPSMVVPTPDVLCGATGEPCLTQYSQKHKQNSRNREVAIPYIRIFCADSVPIFFLTASASTVPLRYIEIFIGCGWKNCNSFWLRERERGREIDLLRLEVNSVNEGREYVICYSFVYRTRNWWLTASIRKTKLSMEYEYEK